jgi:mannose-1-phosphate guanylyltransferase
MTSRPEIVPVILAGGRDPQLWPLTHSKRAKAFLSLGTGLSFFQRTVLRVRAFAPPLIVCDERHKELAQDQLKLIKSEYRAIIHEPESKGTAAAVALAAHYLKGQGLLMLVMPSDHILKNVRAFEKAVIESLAYTIDHMVLFGVKPTAPETEYGYIVTEMGKAPCRPVRKFIEKPSLEDAQALMMRPDCLWNTGMFLTRPHDFPAADGADGAAPVCGYSEILRGWGGRTRFFSARPWRFFKCRGGFRRCGGHEKRDLLSGA